MNAWRDIEGSPFIQRDQWPAVAIEGGRARRLALGVAAVVTGLLALAQVVDSERPVQVAAESSDRSIHAFADLAGPASTAPTTAEPAMTSNSAEVSSASALIVTTEATTTAQSPTTVSSAPSTLPPTSAPTTASTASTSTTSTPTTVAPTTAVPTTVAPSTTSAPSTVTTGTSTSTTTSTTTATTVITTTTQPQPACDPNYAGACVPIASDVDCAGGSGNGPAYVQGPVQVIGSDIYGLDSDNDGIGCE